MPTTFETKRPDAPVREPIVKKTPGSQRLIATAACWALGLFLTVNGVLLSISNEQKPAKSAGQDTPEALWSGTGSIDLAINGLAALKQRPTVMLLGSSLIMHPFWAMDAQSDAHIADIFHYHGSKALESKLAALGAPSQRVYSLAIFGQMVSDAFIYVDGFLKGDKKPDVLLLGIAPRDFSDADLPAPIATFTFKRLVGLENFAKYADSYLPGWQDKADFVATHCCYFYGKRWRLQHEVEKGINKAYAFLGMPTEKASLAQNADPAKNTAGFMLTGSNEERWTNSTKEYRRRYHDIANRDLSIQEGFLNKLLAVCAERHIKVVVVNMPLTAANRELLPPGFYQNFCDKIQTIAARPNVKFVDLGASPDFTNDDFWDTAHLNHFGGHKLVDRVAKQIADQLPRH